MKIIFLRYIDILFVRQYNNKNYLNIDIFDDEESKYRVDF